MSEWLVCDVIANAGWNFIQATSSIDVDEPEEIVRCKACRFNKVIESSPFDNFKFKHYVCTCDQWTSKEHPVHFVEPNDFCSNGERSCDDCD